MRGAGDVAAVAARERAVDVLDQPRRVLPEESDQLLQELPVTREFIEQLPRAVVPGASKLPPHGPSPPPCPPTSALNRSPLPDGEVCGLTHH